MLKFLRKLRRQRVNVNLTSNLVRCFEFVIVYGGTPPYILKLGSRRKCDQLHTTAALPQRNKLLPIPNLIQNAWAIPQSRCADGRTEIHRVPCLCSVGNTSRESPKFYNTFCAYSEATKTQTNNGTWDHAVWMIRTFRYNLMAQYLWCTLKIQVEDSRNVGKFILYFTESHDEVHFITTLVTELYPVAGHYDRPLKYRTCYPGQFNVAIQSWYQLLYVFYFLCNPQN